jgi:hypothetical protein
MVDQVRQKIADRIKLVAAPLIETVLRRLLGDAGIKVTVTIERLQPKATNLEKAPAP